MDKIKPNLIDYNLINFPKKLISPIKKKIVNTDNTKLYINLVMLGLLIIGIYILYYRNQNKSKYNEENELNLLLINEYINNSLNNNKDKNI